METELTLKSSVGQKDCSTEMQSSWPSQGQLLGAPHRAGARCSTNARLAYV